MQRDGAFDSPAARLIFPFPGCGGVYHDRASCQSGANSIALPATLQQAGSRELFERLKFNTQGRPWEDDMAVDTAVDAELWLILAAMIGWITLGCFLTAHHRHHGPRQSPRH
jgi:hypothetical protein